ncbi:AAA ATPase domain-containing protein [Fibrobacter sp. UWB8]|nr:AAA ATPase-like protein [Fibrobacter sp. UWB6]SHF86005.1 AAA ATPase domain-containing protein [Fibrobacter sp. UWB8]
MVVHEPTIKKPTNPEGNESERNKWNKIIPTDFFNKFKLSVLLNHVRAIYSNASMRSNLLSRLSFLYDVDELQKMGWDEALKRYSANNQDFPVENDLYRKVIESLLLLDDLQDFQKFLLDKYPNMNRDVFYFDLSLEMHRKILEEFVDKCVAMSVLTPFFTLLWRPQSSGEENFIKLFSRIYYSLRSEKRRNAAGKNKNIHLFIDEADLYLHPEWQRCWLDEFVNIMDVVLKRIYGSSVPKIQLFMSTHSPYIISDFPKENITLLKQSIETKQVEIENSHSLSPFGGNLYDLLSANFFVDNSIGSFSEELIGKAVEYSYNPNSMTDIEKQKMEYVIKSIGDPIIGSMIEEVK